MNKLSFNSCIYLILIMTLLSSLFLCSRLFSCSSKPKNEEDINVKIIKNKIIPEISKGNFKWQITKLQDKATYLAIPMVSYTDEENNKFYLNIKYFDDFDLVLDESKLITKDEAESSSSENLIAIKKIKEKEYGIFPIAGKSKSTFIRSYQFNKDGIINESWETIKKYGSIALFIVGCLMDNEAIKDGGVGSSVETDNNQKTAKEIILIDIDKMNNYLNKINFARVVD